MVTRLHENVCGIILKILNNILNFCLLTVITLIGVGTLYTGKKYYRIIKKIKHELYFRLL